jgi:hypothetical protein
MFSSFSGFAAAIWSVAVKANGGRRPPRGDDVAKRSSTSFCRSDGSFGFSLLDLRGKMGRFQSGASGKQLV